MDRIFLQGMADNLERPPKIVALTTTVPTYQMKPGDHVVIATSAAGDAAGIIYLPPLAEAVGQWYFIIAPTGATADDISVYEKETGAEFTTYGDLDADGDYVLFFAGPTAWYKVLGSAS